MAIDPYALCPCGSGKKLKFCCSDVVGEIDKIYRMIEGDQPRAALRHVEQTLATHANRASLLDLKASLELSLGELEAARGTIKAFVADHPDSPAAHACQALLLADADRPREAAASLQRALSLVERDMPQRVYEAIGAVGGALLVTGHIVSAQAHLWLHFDIAPKEDTRGIQAIIGLNQYSGLPLLLRDQLRFRPWPEDVPWRAEAERASHLVDHGKWQEAVAVVDRLGQSYGAHPTLVFNRALLGGWLVDERALVAGLHAYAQLDVPPDDAIEAEAIAQLLDPDLKEQQLDTVRQSYVMRELETLVSRFAADGRIRQVQLDPDALHHGDGPPPRYTYMLLDRPMPESGIELTRDQVPSLVGMLAVYGRETDRPERLELSADKGPNFETTLQSLREAAGGGLGEMLAEEVLGTVSLTDQALNWRWQLPRDTPLEVRRRLIDQERLAAFVERWPALPRPGLGGRTPREAAGDQSLRIPLMAAVLILEQAGNPDLNANAVVQLRSALGLPQPEPIDPGNEPVHNLPLVRVARLKLDAVSDDDLVQLYRRAMLAAAQSVVARVAKEAVRRPSLADRIPPDEAYRRLIAAERDPERALAYIVEARERSRSAGESVAKWDLAELELHITCGDAEQARELIMQIERDHMDDPEVVTALYRLLYDMGVIQSDGMPVQGADEEAPLAGVAAAPAAGRIWTPDSDRPSGGKSTLWTPS